MAQDQNSLAKSGEVARKQKTDQGLLVAERFPGGYAFTEAEFLAMTGSAPESC